MPLPDEDDRLLLTLLMATHLSCSHPPPPLSPPERNTTDPASVTIPPTPHFGAAFLPPCFVSQAKKDIGLIMIDDLADPRGAHQDVLHRAAVWFGALPLRYGGFRYGALDGAAVEAALLSLPPVIVPTAPIIPAAALLVAAASEGLHKMKQV